MKTDQKFPDFLCIGSPKCGSTWLHELLESHPRVFIPGELKEIHFFDKKFEKGLGWYSRFFGVEESKDKLVGDITPHYLYTDPQRIATCNSVKKLIIIYRDPVDRCVSHYKFRMRLDNYNDSFENFLEDYPESIDWSMYGKHFENYLNVFDRSQFLILCFEEATQDIEAAKQTISDFLGLDVSLFPDGAGQSKVNQSYKPRFRTIYMFAIRIAKFLGDSGLYRIRNWLKRSALVKRFLTNESQKFELQISEDTRCQLRETFANDQALFHSLINR